MVEVFKYVFSTMGVSKESISKFLIGNRFHVKLRILGPYSNRIGRSVVTMYEKVRGFVSCKGTGGYCVENVAKVDMSNAHSDIMRQVVNWILETKQIATHKEDVTSEVTSKSGNVIDETIKRRQWYQANH